ncbi:MAG TPA: efflux RND transporter periplasmic adaptor subunit [Candidatus Krumholzibacterium sp.]|nr:efflux RND transporter periplasmic adaptor subunit [Candidatus Krumholzibacterium sp.]
MKTILPLLTVIMIMASCGGGDDSVDTEISVPVSVEEVTLKPIEQFITATGTVNSVAEMTVLSEKSGYYELQVNPATGKPFAIGDRVRRDQVIIRLTNEEEENNIRLDSAKLALETSKLDFEKQQSLYEKGGVTLMEYKNSEKAYMDARYNYENAQIQLAKLRIKAPFDGLITGLPYYTAGTKVDAGKEMVQVMDYSSLYLEVNLPGKDLGSVDPGFGVRIMNYTMVDDTLSGAVTQVSPTLDPDTRSFMASIEIDNPLLRLRPGMFVKAEIIVARHDSAIVIPKDVILVKQRGKTVFIVEKGAAQERVIVTGLENPDEIEVLEGLKKDERLVVKGFETLRNRSKVKVIR